MKNTFETRPIIVIGMHRSGTTLLTKLMEKGGVFWGRQKDEYNESIFFQDLNERLFSMANATWDHPEPVKAFMADHRHLDRAEKILRRLLSQSFHSSCGAGKIRAISIPCPSGAGYFLLPV